MVHRWLWSDGSAVSTRLRMRETNGKPFKISMKFMLNPRGSWLTDGVSCPAEMTNASGELERFPATVAGFLPRLPVPCHEPHQIYSPEPGLGSARPAGRAGRKGRKPRGRGPDQSRARIQPRSGRAGRRGGRGAGIRGTRYAYRAPAARSAYGRGDRPRRGAKGLRI